MDKAHLGGFDWLRLLGLFSVVWIHACNLNSTVASFVWLHEYAVPCFILMAVFFTVQTQIFSFRDFRSFLGKRTFRLLLPLLLWSIVYVAARMLKHGLGGAGESIPLSFESIIKGGVSYHLWFLPAIFLYQLLAVLLLRVSLFSTSLFLLLTITGGCVSFSIPYWECFQSVGTGFDNRFLYYLVYPFVGAAWAYGYHVKGYEIPTVFLLVLCLIGLISYLFEWGKEVFTLVYSVCAFCVALRAASWTSPKLRLLASYCMGAYLVHALILEGAEFVATRLGVVWSAGVVISLICMTYCLSFVITICASKFKLLRKIGLVG